MQLVQQLQDKFPQANLVGGDAEFEQWVAQVVGFVEAPKLGLGLPLDIRGTAFQQRVWQALREIPIGETASYADIASRIGSPTAVRAVAGACAANILAVAIPVIESFVRMGHYRVTVGAWSARGFAGKRGCGKRGGRPLILSICPIDIYRADRRQIKI